MDSLKKRYEYYLSTVIYNELKILINNIKPVIKALDMFINDIILTPKENIVYRVDNIEIYIDENMQEFRINDNQNYICSVINLDTSNVQKYFKDEKDDYFNKLKEKDINIPQELYGNLFVCSLKAVEYFVDKKEIDDVDIFIKSIGRVE